MSKSWSLKWTRDYVTCRVTCPLARSHPPSHIEVCISDTFAQAHFESGDVMTQISQLEVWDSKAAVEVQQKKQSAESAASAAAKPMYVLWSPSHSCHLMKLSSLNLLAVPGRIGDVHVSDEIS